jgi:hypothetical protein
MTVTATAEVSYAYDTYMQLLAMLPDTWTRADRAVILDQMGILAEQLASQTYGQAAENDPAGDSLAWGETASLVRHLAAAERGDTLAVIIPLEDDDLDDDEDDEPDPGEDGDDFTDLNLWSRLAAAATRYEHTAAVHQISQMLLARGTRPHAYEAFMAAATGCTIGYPGTYPAQA